MKLGLDFHGMLNTDADFFYKLIKRLKPGEIHIMTGARRDTFVKEIEDFVNDKYFWFIWLRTTHFFSISDYIAKNYPKKINLSKPDNPHVEDKKLWDSQKGIYAKKYNLDLTIDDTIDYAEYFTTPFMLFVKNKI